MPNTEPQNIDSPPQPLAQQAVSEPISGVDVSESDDTYDDVEVPPMPTISIQHLSEDEVTEQSLTWNHDNISNV